MWIFYGFCTEHPLDWCLAHSGRIIFKEGILNPKASLERVIPASYEPRVENLRSCGLKNPHFPKKSTTFGWGKLQGFSIDGSHGGNHTHTMTTTPMPMNMTTTMMADADTTMTTTMTTSMTVTWLNLWDWQFSQGGLVCLAVFDSYCLWKSCFTHS